MVERVPCCVWTSNGLALTMLMVLHYWLIENQSIFANKSRNAMVLTYYFLIDSEVIRGIMHLSFLVIRKKCSWLDPAYSWNKQLAHTPFPKKINTPSTTLRFIRFVAKISVLNPKLLADGQWPKETKESVKFFIQSPLILIDRLKKLNRVLFILYNFAHPPFFINFPISKQSQKNIRFINVFFFSIEIPNKNDTSLELGTRPHVNCEIPRLLQHFLKKGFRWTKKRKRRGRKKVSRYANSSSSNQSFPWVIVSTNK